MLKWMIYKKMGIYSDKLTAQSVKNFYLLGPYQGYLEIQEHNFYGKPTETNIIREVD